MRRPVSLLMLLILALLLGTALAYSARLQISDYEAISQLASLKERRAYFVTLSPERKSALWRTHFARAIAAHAEFTPKQREVLALAAAIISPEYARHHDESLCAKGSVFAVAVADAFDQQQRIELFGTLGSPLPKFAHAGVQDDLPDCECSPDSWCANCWSGCGKFGCKPNCAPGGDCGGCGCFYLWNCTRSCLSSF